MKHNSTFLLAAILLIALVCPGFILISSSDYNPSLLSISSNSSLEYEQINTLQNEFSVTYFDADTFDIDMNEFDEEMKALQKELGKLRSLKFDFDFDFDNEEFKVQMEELKKELSELKLEDIQFEFDDEEFRVNMEELKHLDIDLKDLDIELKKLDSFMDSLREELESDGLIDQERNAY